MMMGREKDEEGKEHLMIPTIPHSVPNTEAAVLWYGYVGQPLVSVFLIGDATADRSSRRNSEVYRAVICAHVQPTYTNAEEVTKHGRDSNSTF